MKMQEFHLKLRNNTLNVDEGRLLKIGNIYTRENKT